MHISEGILPPEVLAGGAALAAAGVAIGVRKMNAERLPQTAMLTSAFFVASLIHVPIPGSSVHLVLNGLVGLALGWTAFPAILVALGLQAVLFGHGGPTALGVNTLNMALPAVVCWWVFGRNLARRGPKATTAAAFAAGALGVGLAAVMWAGSLATAGRGFAEVARLLLVAYAPLAAIEGLVTMAAVSFVLKVRPELFLRPTTEGEPHV